MFQTIKLFIIYFIFSFNLIAKPSTLTVYTIKNIMSPHHGFAQELAKKFEKEQNVSLKFVVFNSSADLLMRLKLENSKTKADVILGLDYYHMEDAKDLDLFLDHGLATSALKFPILWGEEKFLPYEYGYLCFLYKEQEISHPPKNFEDMVNNPDIKLLIPNPYTSIPGFGLVLWLKDLQGSKASKTWRRLKPRIISITKNWSQAYTLFQKGEGNVMLSYTNAALHLAHLGKKGFAVALFEDGQYLQSSLIAVIKTSKHTTLGIKFLETMLDPQMQTIISKKTWMYPVTTSPQIKMLTDSYIHIETARTIHPKVATMNRRTWVKEWRNALSKSPA